uniref:Secreted protein n=1 Tax=Oryza meridionalis TaxID=40149 RepID=A0A0E0DFH0_9ORYZ
MIVLLLSITVAISPVDEGKCSTKPQRLPAAIGFLWVRKQHQDQKATQKTGSSDQKATSSVCFRNSDQIYASTTLASSSVCPSSSALTEVRDMLRSRTQTVQTGQQNVVKHLTVR